MANLKERIRKELIIQEGIEGKSEDIELVRKCLEIIHTSNTWNTLINVKWHRYGTKSYEMHRLYYPSQLLKNIMKLGVSQSQNIMKSIDIHVTELKKDIEK